jgi:DsbC/DsbD-like thiol-disulfide interchange protein
MAKTTLLTILFFVFTSTLVKAQLGKYGHAQWQLSTKKISECEYDLIFTVTLDKGWHTFSINKVKGAELEVFATQINFTPDKNYSLVGTLTETKPTPEFDETIDKTVFVHYKKVVFTQRVKLNSSSTIKVSGRYQYQVCNQACEQPPYEKFDFELKGTVNCKK